MSNKAKIRETFLKTRSFLSMDYKKESSKMIERKVLHFIERYNLDKIGIFISNENEPNTLNIITKCLEKNIEVYVPKMLEDNLNMEFRKINDLQNDLVKSGLLNFYEPSDKCEMLKSADILTTIFIPLVAFDLKLNRIGMGQGCYDRWMNQNKFTGYKIGLSQSTQLSNQTIDSDEFDVRLTNVITEKEIFVPMIDLDEEDLDFDVTYSVFNDETLID